MKLAIVGTGYVGLVTGTCFAESGNSVICVDTDKAKIEGLKNGVIPIYEPGLEALVIRNVKEDRLFFTSDINEAIDKSTLLFIATGTPTQSDGSADISSVLAVAKSIGQHISGYKIIVDKSTVPVGTAERVKQIISEEIKKRGESVDFDVVSNPEFLKEGNAVDDFMKPERVVVGCENNETAEIMKELYSPFVRTGKPIMIMRPAAAEMTKYASNAMLAARISFMNEIAALCERLNVDVAEVRQGMASDSRIGSKFLFPGAGYGGSCFPKDRRALIKTGKEHSLRLQILEAVESVNNRQKMLLFEKLVKRFGTDMKGLTVAVWGLAFKPNTDDMREAPSVVLINSLLGAGAAVKAYDPEAVDEAKKIFGGKITYAGKGLEALKDADALAIVTEWREFCRPDFDKIKALLKRPIIIDGRNLFNPALMAKMGFDYEGIGRK